MDAIVLFWGDNAAGPDTCLTGLLWLREKRALSGQQREVCKFNGALYVCTPRMLWMAMLGVPPPPRTNGEPGAQRGCGRPSSRSQPWLPPQSTTLKHEIPLILKSAITKYLLLLTLDKGPKPCTFKCGGSPSHKYTELNVLT